MEHTTIAVDLAKSVFQVAVSHQPGRVDDERRLSRDRFLAYFAQQAPATVLLEACGSAHYWARQLQPFGHAVGLLAPHDVRPYVRRNKTDRTDAKGLLEANRNEEIHPVSVKSVAQQAITPLHCPRSTWLATRTARLNTVRGLLREFGIFIPTGAHHVVPRVRALVAETLDVPTLLHATLTAVCDEIEMLETNMRRVERQLATLAADMANVALVQTVPGVGLITATALVALVTPARRVRTVTGQTCRDSEARWWRAQTGRAHRSRPLCPAGGAAGLAADLRPDLLRPQLRVSTGTVGASGGSGCAGTPRD
jgi:transposase